MTWITVTLTPLPAQRKEQAYPLCLRFGYDPALREALKADFGGEAGCLRWDPDGRCWRLRRSQFDALLAGYGERISVHPDALWYAWPGPRKRA